MILDSSADFTDEVTSKELFNITLIKNHLCYIVWKGYLILSVSVLKVVCLLSTKSQKVLDTTSKI
jgi:hypothetical protein